MHEWVIECVKESLDFVLDLSWCLTFLRVNLYHEVISHGNAVELGAKLD